MLCAGEGSCNVHNVQRALSSRKYNENNEHCGESAYSCTGYYIRIRHACTVHAACELRVASCERSRQLKNIQYIYFSVQQAPDCLLGVDGKVGSKVSSSLVRGACIVHFHTQSGTQRA